MGMHSYPRFSPVSKEEYCKAEVQVTCTVETAHTRRPDAHLEIGDEGGGVEAQGSAVDSLAAPLQQQQLVEGLHA